MNVETTLAERQNTHGDFATNAACSQALKSMVKHHTCVHLTGAQREALDNICQKMARVITGNPNHADNWHDIAGYATLVEKSLDNS